MHGFRGRAARCVGRSTARRGRGPEDHGEPGTILIFAEDTGRPVELDLRGSVDEVVARLTHSSGDTAQSIADTAQRGRGRPRLGVVAREVTLLPRHWDWLNDQPGGTSVALRRLVETARTANAASDKIRHAQEATDRFMRALAGDLPGYEDAGRALYARDPERFARCIESWPTDIRDHALRLSALVFEGGDGGTA